MGRTSWLLCLKIFEKLLQNPGSLKNDKKVAPMTCNGVVTSHGSAAAAMGLEADDLNGTQCLVLCLSVCGSKGAYHDRD